MDARECVVCVCLPPGLLYPAQGVRLPTVDGGLGCRDMGLLELLLHHYRCRTYLEGDGLGVSAADDSGYRAKLQGEIPVGLGGNGYLRSFRGEGQPRADDVLLSVYHPLYGDRLSGGCDQATPHEALPEGNRRMCDRRTVRYLSEYQ